MSNKFVADLLNDNLDIHGKGAAAPPAFSAFSTPALAAAEVAARKAQLDELEKDFTDDPDAVLRRFRELFQNDNLSLTDVRGWIDTFRFATDHPDDFEREVQSGQPSFGIGDWFNRLRAYLHVPPDTSKSDQMIVDALADRYNVDPDIKKEIRPNVRQFETLDPGWAKEVLGKFDEVAHRWPKGLADFRRHTEAASGYIYSRDLPYDGTTNSKVALMSDFGTGYYHATAIARQLFKAQYSHLFHLGDVYYGGTQEEFNTRFQPQLSAVVQNTQFYGLAENHELYSGGGPYLKYLDTLRANGSTQQEGSYFCVRFQHHQFIGVDVNWQGRQTYVDKGLRTWLHDVINSGGDRTNILLTGSAPYKYGDPNRTIILGHLWEFVATQKIHLWFWGDDHYCALFKRHETQAPFMGSCIGHAGYPNDKNAWGKKCPVTPLWVETASRFPAWTKLRQERGNNGWVQANLHADGGLDLTYVDWLGAARYFVMLARPNKGHLVPIGGRELGNRDDAMTPPVMHDPHAAKPPG
jgi:hypothetical protein